ncbi:hypothetical protein UFOVP78_42 [uncultured Caudovirales phage]|uniref:Uncharacterized protein n=1 Tax=uncultured Caudovirales phage TaxID=2100421 RepID=A0A6J5KX93_9CAUD|nr:hypothetical protein UFOVP78_42 [uncultured Caudovirales phage]
MNDMSTVIVPKSDQISADDLLSGPRTICITGVSIRPGTEQPVTISFEGDDGRPFKPCKSMCRVMVAMWGADAKNYVGRSLTLYRDPAVKWGGMEVGGIRISDASHIDRPMTMALTQTKGSKKLVTVKVLKVEAPKPAEPEFSPQVMGPDGALKAVKPAVWLASVNKALKLLDTAERVREWSAKMAPHISAVGAVHEPSAVDANKLIEDRLAELSDAEAA